MTGTTGQLLPGVRMNDYSIDHELPAKPGEVAFAATHTLLPRRARITSLHPTFVGAQSIALALMREACILEALRHPGVPRVYECGLLADRRPWIAQELIDGPTIADELATSGRLAVSDVITLLRDVAEILQHAHARGLVHRNIRPEVIVRRLDGPCIVDWADARPHDAATHQPVPDGSLAYQPPEVAGGGPVDRCGDVFALGVVAYEALSLAGPTVSAARRCPSAPRRLTALIDRMLAVDPLARPTCGEVRAEAVSIVELVDIPVPSDDDDGAVEEVEIEITNELADADADVPVPPPPRPGKLRWTPADGNVQAAPPATHDRKLPSQLLGPGRRRAR